MAGRIGCSEVLFMAIIPVIFVVDDVGHSIHLLFL